MVLSAEVEFEKTMRVLEPDKGQESEKGGIARAIVVLHQTVDGVES